MLRSWDQGVSGQNCSDIVPGKEPQVSPPAAILTPVAQCSQNFSSIIARVWVFFEWGRDGREEEAEVTEAKTQPLRQ